MRTTVGPRDERRSETGLRDTSGTRARALLLYQKQFSTLGVRKRSSRLFLAAQMHGTGVKIANGCCAKFQVNSSWGGAWGSADVRGRV